MDKKGQIYILVALILCVAIFMLVSQYNVVEQEKMRDDFDELSDNFAIESTKFLNSLFISEGNVFDSFTNFTILFTSYSKAQNPNFGLIYAFNYNDTIAVGNFLNTQIIVDNGTQAAYDLHPLTGCFDAVATSLVFEGFSFSVDAAVMGDITNCTLQMPNRTQIWIGIGDMWYPFNLTAGKPELIIVAREESGEQRQVYMDGVVPEDKEKVLTGSDYCGSFGEDDCEEGEREEICNWVDSKSKCFVRCSGFYDGSEEGCKSDACCYWFGGKGRKKGWCLTKSECK